MKYNAIRFDGAIVSHGDILHTFRGEEVTFISCTHPRKVLVQDETGFQSTFYASVVGVGIQDDESKTWTFVPTWNDLV
jgi:hypothetical protein